MSNTTKYLLATALIVCCVGLPILFSAHQGDSIDSVTLGNKSIADINDAPFETAQKTKGNKTGSPEPSNDVNANCAQYNAELATLADNKIKQIEEFNKYLITIGLNRKDRDEILQLNGLPLLELRRHTSQFKFNYIGLDPIKGDIKILPKPVSRRIGLNLITQNYDPIIAQVTEGKITTSNIIGGNSVLAAIIVENPKIDSNVLEQLIVAGLTPSFADLVALMRVKEIPSATIKQVAKHNNDKLDTDWLENYHGNTLTVFAAHQLNYDLFMFWLNAGSPISPARSFFTALDVLPVPTNEQELAQATMIFSELADRNVAPYGIHTLNAIQKWLPSTVQHDYVDYFNQFERPAMSDDQMSISSEFAAFIDSHEIELTKINQTFSHCAEAKRESAAQLDGSSKKKSVADFQSLNEEEKKMALVMLEAMNTGDWASFLSDDNPMSQTVEQDKLHKLGLMLAITNNHPFETIKGLLDKGAVLLPETIFTLATQGNLELTKSLLPYGLDLFAEDAQARNALYYVATAKSSLAMMNYLLQNDVSVNEVDLLLPLLSSALTVDTVSYCKILVQYGHEINTQHKIQLTKLREQNNELYHQLAPIFGIQ